MRGSSAAAMETIGGKIYLLNESALFKIDLASMKVEATASLIKIIEEEKAQAKEGQEEEAAPLPGWLQRYDANGDGKIERDELDNPDRTWRWVGRFDRDGDGAITGKEARSAVQQFSRGASSARKPAIINVLGNVVLVFTQDRLFKFDRGTLKYRKSVDVSDPEIEKDREARRKRDAEAAKKRRAHGDGRNAPARGGAEDAF